MLLHFLPLQARLTVLLAPSMSASRAAAVSHRRKSTAVSAGIVPQQRVVGAMLTSKDTNVRYRAILSAAAAEHHEVRLSCAWHCRCFGAYCLLFLQPLDAINPGFPHHRGNVQWT
jgi:hypothetical protein